jgi:patatin-like phospholipase/acyl hydrolase
MPPGGPYRILSIDGGGIRGLIPTILLQRLSAEPAFAGWLNSVDLFAGTSTGALIALALAKPLDLQVILDVYEHRGKDIFDDSWLDNITDLGRTIGADYGIDGLARELKRIFGTDTLGDLSSRVMVASFDLDNESDDVRERTWMPKIFHNFPGSDSDAGQPVWKVGLYTSAAPTYFPSADGYIDGGVFANNPSMCALAQSQDNRVRDRPALDEVRMLSLGTGTSLTYIKGRSLDWGEAQWVKPLINLMMDGVIGIADFQCRQLLGDSYHRLAPTFDPGLSFPLDDVGKVPEMVAFANAVDLDSTLEWMEKHWLG